MILVASASEASSNGTNLGISNPSAGALQLRLQLANQSKGYVTVSLEEFNPLPHSVNVSEADNWALTPPTKLRDLCDNFVVAFAIFQGNYGLKNFTNATPLAWTRRRFSQAAHRPQPEHLTRSGRLSNNATISSGSSYSLTPQRTVKVSILGDVAGYWTGNRYVPGPFNSFDLGTYTVVAMDQWGQVALVHFAVK
jgi:hypothetical protein